MNERRWKYAAIGMATCMVMMFGLIGIGAMVSDSPPTATITHHHHYNTNPTVLAPAPTPVMLAPVPETRPSPIQHALYVPQQEQPSTTVINVPAAPTPVPKTTVIMRERPDTPPDQTVVFYQPEIRQPQTKIVVVDERVERLRGEYEIRQAELLGRPQRVVGHW